MYNDLIRLSDLQKFPIRMGHYDTVHGNEHYIFGVEAVIEYAENLPRVNAEPVKHGRWIEYTYWIGSFGQIHTKCSECGTDYPCRKGGRGDGKGGKFCEECGAKMDLEENV